MWGPVPWPQVGGLGQMLLHVKPTRSSGTKPRPSSAWPWGYSVCGGRAVGLPLPSEGREMGSAALGKGQSPERETNVGDGVAGKWGDEGQAA